jgi:hypothetical protein
MKQTAVEYLFNELWNTDKDKFMWHSILEKAKQMEFRQRETDFIAGGRSAFSAAKGKDFTTFEEYIEK